ncbi:linear amide C-N hydrolase [Shewanella algae]|uniref:linear amide C-N hydrolase n=1 Tax=Shewanella algae TaxID=38313 RepID=UPI0016419340|nr:linear amide C-N hydrolase [Shewanella algae]MBO2583516.1 linear amide C-N hydrolase [Shewanella algae]MDC8856042.1 linear amide C-N hydrolase [Shewanella algae]QNI00025.1 linear amide C-N hydrolase [Shewanella algae]
MRKPFTLKRSIFYTVLAANFVVPVVGHACTSLLYKDANGAPYAGRTMELPEQLDYKVAFFPKGSSFSSRTDKHMPLDYKAKHSFVSITMPDPISKDLKVVEGLNDQGLSFSVLAFASTKGPSDKSQKTQKILSAIDLGSWVLSQFKTVGDVKLALLDQPVLVTALLPLGLMKTPFHYTLHDVNGDSIVIEFSNGQQHIYDNPLGVMTNGPEFPWHLTNLNNYTFLSNVDDSKLELGGVEFVQPDSGIATSGLPASNTSVGRFVRAVYYSQFAEKAKTPDEAVTTLAHIMNNFDRPRGITMDSRVTDALQDKIAPGVTGHTMYTSEYTTWTALSDLKRLQLNIRLYNSLNYVTFDLHTLQNQSSPAVVPLSQFTGEMWNGTQELTVSY